MCPADGLEVQALRVLHNLSVERESFMAVRMKKNRWRRERISR